jgi:hypothetical protein
MSMNLARQSYSLDPEYFIAGTTIRIITEVKTAGADLKAHVPVVLADGKVTAVADKDASGLYGITADSASSGDDVVVYLTGEFFADALEMPDGVTAADIEVAFRDIGIFLK